VVANRSILLFLGAAIAAVHALAQPVSAGLKGGVPFSDAFNISGTTITIPASTRSLIFGPTVEIHLPFNLGVEVDALHRSLSATATDSGAQWEFPILLKHYFLPGPVRPYGEGGINFNHLSGFSDLAKSPLAAIKSGTTGFTAGAGIELKISRLRIAPELRLTYWKDPNVRFTLTSAGVISKQTQASFLIGISF
jgi:opacity protein-like surface antigen